MITKLRNRIKPVLDATAPHVGKVFPPNALTLLNLISALAYIACIEMLQQGDAVNIYVALLFYAASAAFDVLDGAVARATGRKSKFGAFLDSTTDRIVDAIYIFSLYLLHVINIEGTMLLLVASYLISYVRARAEALGVHMEGVGIIERGERVILTFIAVALTPISLPASKVLVYLLIILSLITALQRIYHVHKNLK